jgi:DNA-binding MarR family transcriptional regulator
MNPSKDILEKAIFSASAILAEMEMRTFHDERFSELSVRQMLYLNMIIQMGHPTFSDLAKELGVSKPSVTANVTRLIHKGYVKKVQDHEDLRAYHIMPTTKADEFDALHQSIHKNFTDQLTAQLDPGEVDQLAILLSKALQGIKE